MRGPSHKSELKARPKPLDILFMGRLRSGQTDLIADHFGERGQGGAVYAMAVAP